jgi:hypothetical protein
MWIFIYIQIHMLQARVKELKKELERPSEHGKRIMSRLVCFLRKERGGQEGGGSRGSGLSLE